MSERFELKIYTRNYGYVKVEADSLDEAKKKVLEKWDAGWGEFSMDECDAWGVVDDPQATRFPETYDVEVHQTGEVLARLETQAEAEDTVDRLESDDLRDGQYEPGCYAIRHWGEYRVCNK